MALQPSIGPSRSFEDNGDWPRHRLYKIEVEMFIQPRPQVRVYRHNVKGDHDLETEITLEVDAEWDDTMRVCVV